MAVFRDGKISINGSKIDLNNIKQIIENGNCKEISVFKKITDKFEIKENDNALAIVYSIKSLFADDKPPETYFKGLMKKYLDIEWIFLYSAIGGNNHNELGNCFIVFKNNENVFEESEWYDIHLDYNEDFDEYNEDEEDEDDEYNEEDDYHEFTERYNDVRLESLDTFYFTCMEKWSNKKKNESNNTPNCT